MPVLEIGLKLGDVTVAEPGEFSWMSDVVRLTRSRPSSTDAGFHLWRDFQQSRFRGESAIKRLPFAVWFAI